MIEQGAVLGHQRQLGRGGSGVDAQIAVALVGGQIAFLHAVALMARGERVVVRLALKQGLHALDLELHLDAV